MTLNDSFNNLENQEYSSIFLYFELRDKNETRNIQYDNKILSSTLILKFISIEEFQSKTIHSIKF